MCMKQLNTLATLYYSFLAISQSFQFQLFICIQKNCWYIAIAKFNFVVCQRNI
jgi:hypothetical protein